MANNWNLVLQKVGKIFISKRSRLKSVSVFCKQIYSLLHVFRMKFGIAIFASVVSGSSTAILIALIHQALVGEDTYLSSLAWQFLGLCMIVFAARIASRLLMIRLGQKIAFNLRMCLSRQILGAPFIKLEKLGNAPLFATLTNDVQAITGLFSMVPMLCINCAVVLGCLIYLGWLSLVLLCFIFAFIVLGVLSYRFVTGWAMSYLRLAREDQDALFDCFRGLTSGIKELKLHNQRKNDFLSKMLRPTVRALQDHTIVGRSIFALASSWSDILFFGVVGLLVFVLAKIEDIDAAIISGFVLATLYMMGPLGRIIGIIPQIGQAQVALQKIERLGFSFLAVSDDELIEEEVVMPLAWDYIELINVSHTYFGEADDQRFTLGPLDFTFGKGELIFLVGGNGSGKTTFAKLLVGLYETETGNIFVDGHPITNENREAYRQCFSAIFTDFYLFDRLLGIQNTADDNKIKDYLKLLELDHKVKLENGVFSTVNLSQGQRKRLALLTACLEDRPFYVFDEWASDQDPLFKKVFYQEILLDLQKMGKSILVICHDDQYMGLADRLIKLDYGQIVSDTLQKKNNAIVTYNI